MKRTLGTYSKHFTCKKQREIIEYKELDITL